MRRNVKVYIGRFQPFHNGHLTVLRNAIATSDHVILVIGTAFAPRSTKNPWTQYERWDMIRLALTPVELMKVTVLFKKDHPGDPDEWTRETKKAIYEAIEKELKIDRSEADITLVGNKGGTDASYYFKDFPEWKQENAPHYWNINATDIRSMWLGSVSRDWEKHVPPSTAGYLTAFKGNSYAIADMHRGSTT